MPRDGLKIGFVSAVSLPRPLIRCPLYTAWVACPLRVREKQISADLRNASNGDGFACTRRGAGRDEHRRHLVALAARSAPP